MKKIFTYLSALALVCSCVSTYDKDASIIGHYNHEFISRIDHFIDENGDTLHYGAGTMIQVHIAGTFVEQVGKRVERYSNIAYWLSDTDSKGRTTKSHVTILEEGCLETVLNEGDGPSSRVLYWDDYTYVAVTPKSDGTWCSFKVERKR